MKKELKFTITPALAGRVIKAICERDERKGSSSAAVQCKNDIARELKNAGIKVYDGLRLTEGARAALGLVGTPNYFRIEWEDAIRIKYAKEFGIGRTKYYTMAALGSLDNDEWVVVLGNTWMVRPGEENPWEEDLLIEEVLEDENFNSEEEDLKK